MDASRLQYEIVRPLEASAIECINEIVPIKVAQFKDMYLGQQGYELYDDIHETPLPLDTSIAVVSNIAYRDPETINEVNNALNFIGNRRLHRAIVDAAHRESRLPALARTMPNNNILPFRLPPDSAQRHDLRFMLARDTTFSRMMPYFAGRRLQKISFYDDVKNQFVRLSNPALSIVSSLDKMYSHKSEILFKELLNDISRDVGFLALQPLLARAR